MQNLVTFVLIGFTTAVAVPAAADPIGICHGISNLKHIHLKSSQDQSVKNTAATVNVLNQIEQKISESLNLHSTPEIIRAARNLSELKEGLRRSSNDQHLLGGEVGPIIFRNLVAIMDDLAVVQSTFGCNLTPTENSIAERPPPGRGSISLAKSSPNTINVLAPKFIYAWLFITLAMITCCIAFVLKNRREDDRRTCNVFLHIVYEGQCTVTRIFDISRSGMKIEAAAKNVEKKWHIFHFGGHKVEGKIVWRSKLYAGVKFRERLSEEALDEVMKTSNRPMKESGIEKTSTPCFYDGCHFDCPLHLPTALSLRSRDRGTG